MNLRARMRATPRRTLTSLVLGLVLSFLAGCDRDSYPADLHYPIRSDAVVKQGESLTTEPLTTDRPGELGRIFNIYLKEDERKKLVDPTGLDTTQRNALEKVLHATFGTPAAPTVKDLPEPVRNAIAPIDDDTLARGSRLYRQHCLHCHGLTGDGRGPTAAWINPHPRDFRRGFFKFTSTTVSSSDRRARRADLVRVLREGIDGTGMPSFRLLADGELESLVSYVIHLSLRGQVEAYVINGLATKTFGTEDIEDQVTGITVPFAENWRRAQEPGNVIKPGKYEGLTKESVQRGMKLFLDKGDPKNPGAAAAACISCHLDFGRASTYRFDDWGTIVRPADLTRGVYRGGHRPIDLYWRIHSGINGVGMPAAALKVEEGKPDPIWDIVNFLQVLPYPEQHAKYGVNVDTTLVSEAGH